MNSTPMILTELVLKILHTLLQRFEQENRKNVIRVQMNRRDHKAYFDEHDPTPRETANSALKMLEMQGIVRLHWQRYEVGNWLEKVDLTEGSADELYSLLKRVPRSEQEQALRDLLAIQPRIAGWHATFLSTVASQLAAHRSVDPFNLQDPGYNREILAALTGIATLQEPILERILSVRLFGHSKRLEELRGPILQILRRDDPEMAIFGGEDKAILLAHGVETVPEHVILAGNLKFHLSTYDLDLLPFRPSIGLSARTLSNAQRVTLSADRVITVENATSFTELVLDPSSPFVNSLIILTGGFASPTLIRLLQQIRKTYPLLPFFHWGDLDGGGLRILEHLRRRLGTVQPLAMDSHTLEVHQSFGQPLLHSDRSSLTKLQNQPHLQDCQALIETLLRLDTKLEQEAIRPSWLLNLVP